uniref:Uncharacterized protein n=1 Tax=Brassica oleracea var. oleracea TaxID=109376 RepID=A0A0D2ZTK3_BRAOL
MAAQQAGYEAQRRLNQQMMEMMQRMNGVPRNIPRDMFLGIYRGTCSSEYTEGPRSSEYTEEHVPRNIPREMFLEIFRGTPFLGIFRGTRSSEFSDEHFPRTFRRNFRGLDHRKIHRNIPRKLSLGIFRGAFRRTGGPRNFLGNLFPRNSVGKFRGISEEK